MAELTKKKSGYAWVISCSGFVSQLIVVFSLAMYGMTIASIAASWGEAVTSLAICSSIYGVCYGGFGVVWGNLADRIGIRKELGIASIGAGIWAVLVGLFASNVVTLAVLYGLVGAFCAGISSGVIPKVITSWFDTTWRGKGIIIVSMGGTVAGMLLGVIAPIIIGGYGWAGLYEILGGVNIVLGIIVFLCVRDSPESMGTVPFGADPATYVPVSASGQMTEEEKAAKKAADKEAMSKVLKMPMTWKLGIMLIFWQFTLTASSTYLIASITFAGFSLVTAGLVSTAQTAGMTVGQIVMPIIADKIGRKPVFVFMMIVYACFFAAFYLILGTGNDTLVYLMGFVSGFFNGQTPIMQTSIGEAFPRKLRGTGPGMVTTITLVGRFFGPILAAAVISMAGGATTAALLFACASMAIAGVLGIIFLPKTGGKYGDPMADVEI